MVMLYFLNYPSVIRASCSRERSGLSRALALTADE